MSLSMPVTMILAPNFATKFIDTYKRFLLAIDADVHGADSKASIVEKMYRARKKLVAEPLLMDRYLADASQSDEYDKDILAALRTLKVDFWVYLRDTRSYSIFIKADGSCAYGVLGLTDRIRDIVGGSGVYFDAGVVEINGRYVCDGIIAGVVVLGKGYRQSYTEVLAELRRQGKFHTHLALRLSEQRIQRP